jgi:hypothetical protein
MTLRELAELFRERFDRKSSFDLEIYPMGVPRGGSGVRCDWDRPGGPLVTVTNAADGGTLEFALPPLAPVELYPDGGIGYGPEPTGHAWGPVQPDIGGGKPLGVFHVAADGAITRLPTEPAKPETPGRCYVSLFCEDADRAVFRYWYFRARASVYFGTLYLQRDSGTWRIAAGAEGVGL